MTETMKEVIPDFFIKSEVEEILIEVQVSSLAQGLDDLILGALNTIQNETQRINDQYRTTARVYVKNVLVFEHILLDRVSTFPQLPELIRTKEEEFKRRQKAKSLE